MAQTMLEELLRQYHILTSSTPDVIEIAEELVQESDFIPEGIPALYEYSDRVHRDRRRAKELLNVFMNATTRHRGRLLDFRLVPLILVLAYLSKPMISSMLSSVLEGTGRLKKGIATRVHHPKYVTKAKQTCADPSTEEDSEQETVTFTIAEMVWLRSLTTDLLRNHEESKTRQADMLTAIGDLEDENESLKDDVTRLEARIQDLENQRASDQNIQRTLHRERERFRLGGKDLKEKRDKLQKEYNDLEDERDEHRVMAEKLRDDLKDMTAQRDSRVNDNELLKIENEKLKANTVIDQDAALDYEEAYEDLNQQISRQKRELEAAAKETADLKAKLSAVKEASSEGLTDFDSRLDTDEPKELGSAVQAAGSQFGVKEDTSKPSTQPMNVEQSKAEIWELKKELDELDAVYRRPEPSRDTWRGAIFEQPQGLSDSNVEEGTPLRRTQSAPLWLPLPRHGDTFDPLYDVSDYGNDDDHNDGAGDEEGPGDQDNTHDSGDDSDNGSHQGENDDDDDGDDISGDENSNGAGQDENNDDRHGGADKVPLKAYQTRQDHVGDTTLRPEDTPLPGTPPNGGHIPVIPEPSPQRASPNLNVAAPAFAPTHHSTRPVPFRAMGPEDTKNDHIKKLNEELKRQVWIEKSGKPDLVEGKEGAAVAEDVIDDMYDRQITQFLTFDPINCARGSMWGALNDVPNRLDDVSIPTKKEDDAREASAQIQQNSDAHSSGSQEGDKEHDEDDGEWSDIEDEDHEGNGEVMPMLGRYQVTGVPKDGQKDDATPMLGNYKVTRGPEPVVSSTSESQKKPTVDTQKTNQSIAPAHCKSGAPKDEEESEAAGNRTGVEDGTDGEIQDEDSPEGNGGMPVLGSNKVTRGDVPSNSDHETSGAEKVSGHDSSPPMACGSSTEEISRQDVTTPVPASQSAGPSSDSGTTNQPDVTAASQALPQDVTTPVRVSQSAAPSISDLGTTNQPDVTTVSQASPQDVATPVPASQSAEPSTSDLQTSIPPHNPDTTPPVRAPSPPQSGLENQDTTPIVRLPQQPTPKQTQPAPATPATPTPTQEELDSNTTPKPATSPHPPQPSSPPSTPKNPASQPQDISAPSPSSRGTQDRHHTPPTASIPTRGNARGGRGRGTPRGNAGRGRGGPGTAADSFQRFQERMAREKRG